MFNNFVDIVIRKYDFTNFTTRDVYAKLFYPKLAIITGKRYIAIIDIESNSDDGLCEKDFHYQTEDDIIDVFLQENLLWVLLESGQLILYDVLLGLPLPIVIESDNKSSYDQFKTDGIHLYLFSKNEGLVSVPYTSTEIIHRYNKHKTEIRIKLLKSQNANVHSQNYYDIVKQKENLTGMHLEIERGALIIKCPLTGLRAVAASVGSVDSKYVLPWREFAVITNGNGVWVVNLRDAKIQLELHSMNTYVLLFSWKDSFYYLASDSDKVSIYFLVCCKNIYFGLSTIRELERSEFLLCMRDVFK